MQPMSLFFKSINWKKIGRSRHEIPVKVIINHCYFFPFYDTSNWKYFFIVSVMVSKKLFFHAFTEMSRADEAMVEKILGNKCFEKGEYEAACQHYTNSLNLSSNLIDSYNNRAMCCMLILLYFYESDTFKTPIHSFSHSLVVFSYCRHKTGKLFCSFSRRK